MDVKKKSKVQNPKFQFPDPLPDSWEGEITAEGAERRHREAQRREAELGIFFSALSASSLCALCGYLIRMSPQLSSLSRMGLSAKARRM